MCRHLLAAVEKADVKSSGADLIFGGAPEKCVFRWLHATFSFDVASLSSSVDAVFFCVWPHRSSPLLC